MMLSKVMETVLAVDDPQKAARFPYTTAAMVCLKFHGRMKSMPSSRDPLYLKKLSVISLFRVCVAGQESLQ